MNTHVHADHITGTGKLKSEFPGCKSVLGSQNKAIADIYQGDGSKVTFGSHELEVKNTPGHTNGLLPFSFFSSN